MRELQLPVPEGKEVECLTDAIKAQLRGTSKLSENQETAARRQAVLKNIPAGQAVPEDLLAAASEMQLIESVPLLTNSKANGFVGVNLYCDDSGTFKGLPLNVRATDFAHCCGHSVQILGDAWLARIFDNEHEFKRLDFTLAEVSSSAAWVRKAAEQRAACSQGSAAATLQQLQANASQPKHARAQLNGGEGAVERIPGPEDAARAQTANKGLKCARHPEGLQEDGNRCFKRGKFEEAIGHYDKALELNPDTIAARNNRAVAYLKLGNAKRALEDCDLVLAREPENVKALLRKGQACLEEHREEDARSAWKQVLRLEPGNKQAQACLEQLQGALGGQVEDAGRADGDSALEETLVGCESARIHLGQ